MPDDLVSIVIPAYNPAPLLLEAIASATAQTHPHVEIVLVNDGTNKPEGRAILEQASKLVHKYLEQPNRGLGAARNTGFREAGGEFVLPLDADDLLQPSYVAECLAALCDSDAAFAYTDFQVFGTEKYQERPGEYNLYRLLDRNYLTYAALIRRKDWDKSGGYDETLNCFGYEDWELWLKLGERGRFGRYIAKPLFCYRKHGPSLYDAARARHDSFVAYIQSSHPGLYEYENRARVKARWSPAASVASAGPVTNQTILDIQIVPPGGNALGPVAADARDPQAAELAALAHWGGGAGKPRGQAATARNDVHRHLLNAGLLSLDAWTRHPMRSLTRLVPLRVKERVNAAAGRAVFDLSFYLQFQPNSVITGNAVIEPLRYYPRPAAGRRIALVTPHLGPGGAEVVLYDLAAELRSKNFEILLLATHSRDDGWLAKWRESVDHVYDLAPVIPAERMTAGLCSMAVNWRCDYLLVQNSSFGYAAIPFVRRLLPEIQIVDVIHSIDEAWDQVGATADVAANIDVRVAMSDAVRERLLKAKTPEERIALVRNGVDLERFRPAPVNSAAVKTILFAARLDPVKRPLLVAEIARELIQLRPQRDFRFVIAGDGPERERFIARVRKLGLEAVFDFRGHAADLAPLYAASDLVLLTSRSEGVPLVILEALASARPVVASNVGSVSEVLDSSCGILIERADPLQFATAIHSLLNDAGLRARLGAAGRQKMEAKHDIRKTRQALAGIFDQGSALSVLETRRSTAME